MIDLLRSARWLALAGMFTFAGALPGCAVDEDPVDDESMDDGTGASVDPITEVTHTKVKRQSIGNCWLYATASWVEALHRRATDREIDVSETYLTYWDWFDKIANGSTVDEISTGGSFGTAAELINRYGLTLEKDFVASEEGKDMSDVQKKAEAAINASLKTGALRTAKARRTRSVVRAELDKAFGLAPAVIAQLDAVFGKSVTKTVDKSWAQKPLPAGSTLFRAKDLLVSLPNPQTHASEIKTLQDAIGKKSGWSRAGASAWNEVDYGTTASSRRSFLARVQRALHDGQPVIISWFVDFNALTSDAKFSKAQLDKLGVGSQGGHMTVLSDYEIEGVPGFGTLKAGTKVTDPKALEAALSPNATITFLRIKNSWGSFRPDRWKDAVLPGYHDLMMDYLNGPVQKCGETPAGATDKTKCSPHTPLWDVVLPAGY